MTPFLVEKIIVYYAAPYHLEAGVTRLIDNWFKAAAITWGKVKSTDRFEHAGQAGTGNT